MHDAGGLRVVDDLREFALGRGRSSFRDRYRKPNRIEHSGYDPCSRQAVCDSQRIIGDRCIHVGFASPQQVDHDSHVSGHSHKPYVERIDHLLYLNPGSAGPKRFNLPVSMALLHVEPGGMRAELIEIPG